MTALERLRARAREVARGTANAQSEGSGWTSQDDDAFNRQWDGLTLAQALQMSRDQGWADNRFGETDVDPNDPLAQQFLSQFGTERQYTDANGNPMNRPDSGNTTARGLVMGYGDPTYMGQSGDDQLLQDGSRVFRLPDGRYIREAGNLRGETIAGTHRADETASRNIRRNAAIGALGVLTGGLAFNALGAGAGGGLLGGEAAGAAEGAGSSGLLGGGGGMDAVTAAEWFGGPGAATNPSAGLFGSAAAGVPESAGLLERITVNGSRIPATSGINPGLLTPLAGPAAATFNSLDNAPDIDRAPNNERPWYQNALDNPLQTIGRGLSLYNMGRGLLGNRGNRGNNNGGGGSDEKGGNGEGVETQPLQRGPWQPNPITEQQIQNFQYARPRGI